MYVPGLAENSTVLRSETQAFLSEGRGVTDRGYELDEVCIKAGVRASFASEIEACFIHNPERPAPVTTDKEDLYEQVVRERQGVLGQAYPKGVTLYPDSIPLPILLNEKRKGSYTPEQPGSAIIELRTTPTDHLHAKQNYWRTIQAIGKIAERNNLIGCILSSHHNIGVVERDGELMAFQGLVSPRAAAFIALLQQNLWALHPFRLDAGLRPGAFVLQAYPGKQGKIALHDKRVEVRHELVGIADPDLDILAAMDALARAIQAPNEMLRGILKKYVRFGDGVTFTGPELGEDIYDTLAIQRLGRAGLILPAEIEESAEAPGFWQKHSNFLAAVTKGNQQDIRLDINCAPLRRAAQGIHVSPDQRVFIDSRHPYAESMRQVFASGYSINRKSGVMYTKPLIVEEGPMLYPRSRNAALGSPAIARIFGPRLLKRITPTDKAIDLRQNFIQDDMIVSDEELASAI